MKANEYADKLEEHEFKGSIDKHSQDSQRMQPADLRVKTERAARELKTKAERFHSDHKGELGSTKDIFSDLSPLYNCISQRIQICFMIKCVVDTVFLYLDNQEFQEGQHLLDRLTKNEASWKGS